MLDRMGGRPSPRESAGDREYDPEWNRAYERVIEDREGAVMSEAKECGETTRLHRVAQWWKEKFPFTTKVAIGAGFLAAGLLGGAATAGIVGAGALAWRAAASGMAGVVAGTATHTLMRGRNYSKGTANLWGTLAGTFTGLFSFFGGKMLADYMGMTPLPEANPKLITYIEPGSGMTFDRFLKMQMMAPGGIIADAPLSYDSKIQLFSAIDRTFRHNPDYCRALFGIAYDNPSFPEYDQMMKGVVKDGIQMNFSGRTALFPGVMGKEEFIRDLHQRIARDYPTLSAKLNKNWFNFDMLASRLRTGYRAG